MNSKEDQLTRKGELERAGCDRRGRKFDNKSELKQTIEWDASSNNVEY